MRVDFSAILRPEAVTGSLGASSKKLLFAQLGAMAGRALALDPRSVADCLAERERLGSTGFGHGVAIPHGKLGGLEGIVGLFARLEKPIDYDAVDDLPIDIVFALLSPPGAGADHLKALAMVSRRLRDRLFVDTLRGAGSPDALYALLSGYGQRDAA